MKRKTRLTLTLSGLTAAALVAGGIHAGEPEAQPQPALKRGIAAKPQPGPSTRKSDPPVDVSEPVDPAQNVGRGLEWLASRQQKEGGWGPGHVGPGVEERPTVANTCIALQAFLHAGHGPDDEGPYAKNVRRGVIWVFGQVEASDKDSLFITPLRDTQLQRKLGTYIDTFLASSVLPEFKGKMPGTKLEKRLEKNINAILAKMEAHQEEDGSWKNVGWAPTLAQGLASKGLNNAAQKGFAVNETSRSRAEKFSRGKFDASSGDFEDADNAGIAIYGGASNLSAIKDSAITNRLLKPKLEEELASTEDEEKRAEIRSKLTDIAQCENDLKAARSAVVERLKDPAYVAGFGNNGGEEFLSYLNIGESLRLDGGDEWKAYRTRMTTNLARTQAEDGCWKGQHCITGGTFCTSTGLLVLLMDQAPAPEEVAAAAEQTGEDS